MFGTSIISCIQETCDPVPEYFEITDLVSTNLKYTGSSSDAWDYIEDNQPEPVVWDKYFVRFDFEVDYVAAASSDFGNSLMALSCIEPGHMGDKIGVKSIVIRTVNDYNENYPAGSEINPIAGIKYWSNNTGEMNSFFSIDSYITEFAEGVTQRFFELKLTEAPASSNSFAFDIVYTLNNGEAFTHRTNAVNLVL